MAAATLTDWGKQMDYQDTCWMLRCGAPVAGREQDAAGDWLYLCATHQAAHQAAHAAAGADA